VFVPFQRTFPLAFRALLAYTDGMDIEFDPGKSAKNEAERGFNFAFAARMFLGRTVETIDGRRDYGEVRVQAIGEVDGVVLVVVYTDRGDARRIISTRKADRKERALWHSSE